MCLGLEIVSLVSCLKGFVSPVTHSNIPAIPNIEVKYNVVRMICYELVSGKFAHYI